MMTKCVIGNGRLFSQQVNVSFLIDRMLFLARLKCFKEETYDSILIKSKSVF